MKRRLILIGTALLAGAVLTGCRRDLPPVVTTESTLATVPATHPREETGTPAMPTFTEPSGSTPDRAVPENTIEDGNGPIASQLAPKDY